MTHARHARRAFTLLELAIVLLIAFISVGLLAMVFAGWNRGGNDTYMHTMNNLKQLALAVHNCNDVYKRLPPAFDKFQHAEKPFSIHVHLPPSIGQTPLYRVIVEKGEQMDAVVHVYSSYMDNTAVGTATGVQNFAANLRVFSGKGLNTRH